MGKKENITKKHSNKHPNLGLIPDSWEVHRFADVFEFLPTNSFSRDQMTYGGDQNSIYNIHYGDIHATFNEQILDFNKHIHQIPILLDTTEVRSNDNAFLKDGDLIIADASEDYDGVGECIEITGINKRKVLGGLHTITARDLIGKTVQGFRAYLLKNQRVFINLKKLATGSKVYGVSKGNVAELELVIPPIPEQQKIARILCTWDKAIEKTELLIAQKKQLKKGLMQQLLTGKVRFKEFVKSKSEKKYLSHCIVGKGEYGINAASVSYSKHLPTYLRITDIDDYGRFICDSKVSVDHPDSSSFYLKKGDIVFARTGNTTGKTYLYNPKDGKLVFAGFLIRFTLNTKILLPEFLKLYTETNRYWNWVKVMSSRSGQPGINSQEYSGLELRVPPVEEQKKIASFLNGFDSQINSYRQRLIILERQKKGLMQKLLTGQARVKLN